MASGKAFLALLLLALVSATYARVDFLGMFDNGASPYCPPSGPTVCVECECTEEYEDEPSVCTRYDTRKGECPSDCTDYGACICPRVMCPLCYCKYEVEACPEICPSANITAKAKFENLLV